MPKIRINAAIDTLQQVDFGTYDDNHASFYINVDEKEWTEYVDARQSWETKHIELLTKKRNEI